MDATFETAWDTAALNAASWPILWAELARQVNQVLLLVMAGSLILLIAAAFTPGSKEESGSLYLVTAPLAPIATVEAERVLVPVGAGAAAAQTAAEEQLVRSGLTPMDAVALLSLRRRIESGSVNEDPADGNRLAFARWLAEHGRLEE